MLLPLTGETIPLIEVVRITDPMRHLRSEDLLGDDVAIWDGEQAQETLALIADLPDGAKQRCFIPGWGVRAHGPTEMIFEVALCFRCNGARFWGPRVPPRFHWQTFDGESATALELLRRFQEAGSV